MTTRRGVAGAAALVLLFPLLASAAAAQGPEPQTNLSDIEDEVICLVCGTTLELTDDAPQAQQLRNQIRDLIDRGLTKDEVKDELVAEYGESVLSTPDTEGFDLTAWVLPGLALLIAAGCVGAFVVRNRRQADSDPPPETFTREESKRLDEDLRTFDS